MRKGLNTLLAVLLLSALAAPVASFADENETDNGSSEVESNDTYQHNREQDEVEHRHNKIEEIYEDFTEVVIPPVGVKLGHQADPNTFILPSLPLQDVMQTTSPSKQIPTVEELGVISEEMRANFDPYKLAPVPVDNLVLTRATPEDEFMAGARIFGFALVLAALGLFGATGVNALKSRNRNSKNLNSSEQ